MGGCVGGDDESDGGVMGVRWNDLYGNASPLVMDTW